MQSDFSKNDCNLQIIISTEHESCLLKRLVTGLEGGDVALSLIHPALRDHGFFKEFLKLVFVSIDAEQILQYKDKTDGGTILSWAAYENSDWLGIFLQEMN